MEYTGITVDEEELQRQGLALEKDIKQLTEQIYTYSQEEFNIASPKQLGTVLFEKLAIPYPKKNLPATIPPILKYCKVFNRFIRLSI